MACLCRPGGKATLGLANYLKSTGKADLKVAIAYDSRNNSADFAKTAAGIFANCGLQVYLYDRLVPVPVLSFTTRYLHCDAGVMITASHNPKEYNGYKVYWEDGAQITAPKDVEIVAEVKAITDYHTVKTMSEADAKAQGLLAIIGKEIDDAYMAELKKLVLHQECIDKYGKELKIVYTPLHGTGNIPARRILRELGFENVYVVPEQEKPDPNFTTLEYPNPEDPKAFTYALRLAKEVDADIILATDPDADRLGVYSKDTKSGEYKSFTGNMSGMLIAEYLLSQRKEKGLLHENGAFVKTIVSTNLADLIAKEYNLKLIEVLTGFKYIGEQIKFFEQNNTYEYEFGFEESYGCLVGTHARDKDAIVAVMALCEAAAYYKSKGITLWDQMINIFDKYGYFKEGQKAVTMKGAEGAVQIAKMMDDLRNNPPKKFGAWNVVEFRDYKKDECTVIATGEKKPTGLPESNVLYFELNDHAWCCARPSGTEPKIKFYMGVKGTGLEDADKKLEELTDAVSEIVGL